MQLCHLTIVDRPDWVKNVSMAAKAGTAGVQREMDLDERTVVLAPFRRPIRDGRRPTYRYSLLASKYPCSRDEVAESTRIPRARLAMGGKACGFLYITLPLRQNSNSALVTGAGQK